MLTQEMRTQGAWLFRWRSYVPLVLLAVVMAALAQAGDLDAWPGDHLWEILCVGISLLGLVLRAMVVGFTPKGTSGRNTTEQVAETLNTTGMYSVVRHPLYLGNFLMWLGVALYPRLWWLAVIVALSFWLYYERIMLAEEAFLHGKFGNDFRRWAERTPAFVPAPSRWRAPGRRFSPRKVLRKELSGMLGVVVTFSALEALNDAMAARPFERDPVWTTFLVAGLLVYGLLKFLKRKTLVLRDPEIDA